MVTKQCLIAIGQPAHTGHNAENIVIGSIDTNLGSLGSLNGGVGEDKLEGGVINSGEVTCAAWLVFFWSQCE